MSKLSKVLIYLGAFLITLSLAFMITFVILTNKSQTTCEKIICQLETILPEKNDGFSYGFSLEEMPVLEIEGKDVCGIVEIPKYSLKLPINNEYGYFEIKSMPSRASGSVYDNSLIIAGVNKKGQFDCADNISIGDEINIFDMTGSQFSYVINDISHSKSADENYFISDDDLTLIIKDEYSFESIIVCCTKKF